MSGAGIVLSARATTPSSTTWSPATCPPGRSVVSGGVAVTSGLDGTPPNDNVVKHNRIVGNEPDIFWDQTGAGNVSGTMAAVASTPPSLCD